MTELLIDPGRTVTCFQISSEDLYVRFVLEELPSPLFGIVIVLLMNEYRPKKSSAS